MRQIKWKNSFEDHKKKGFDGQELSVRWAPFFDFGHYIGMSCFYVTEKTTEAQLESFAKGFVQFLSMVVRVQTKAIVIKNF